MLFWVFLHQQSYRARLFFLILTLLVHIKLNLDAAAIVMGANGSGFRQRVFPLLKQPSESALLTLSPNQ